MSQARYRVVRAAHVCAPAYASTDARERTRAQDLSRKRRYVRTCCPECLDVLRPFRPKDVCTGQGAVSSTYDQCINSFFDEIICGRLPAFLRFERHRPRSADEGPTLFENEYSPRRGCVRVITHLTKPAANIIPSNPDDVPSFQRTTADVVASPILQELSIAET